MTRVLSLCALLALSAGLRAESLKTVAEKSGYQSTSLHADVQAFCKGLAQQSRLVRLASLGTSHEGRDLPLLILADPPVASAQEARASGKPVVFCLGNIHAGEVDGKEALLALARDLAVAPSPLLKQIVVLVVPLFNADGNEKLSAKNRTWQGGPSEVGIRANAQGFDLNRDFTKLESPEVRALVRAFTDWTPAVFIDCHTTNGSYHRYRVTYDGPRHPACDARLIRYAQQHLLPDVARRTEKAGGGKCFPYGNFSQDRQAWETYPALPRFGIQYAALRGILGILCESYAYARFKERIEGSYAFVKSCLEHVAQNRERIQLLTRAARETIVEAGNRGRGDTPVPLTFRTVAHSEPVTVLGFEEEIKEGRRRPTAREKEYSLRFVGKCEPATSASLPWAYLIPAEQTAVVQNLHRHGIAVEMLCEDLDVNVEVYPVEKLTKASRPYQGHLLNQIQLKDAIRSTRRIRAGSHVVRTGQPLGMLAAYLLEPGSDDGLAVWNFLDRTLAPGKEFPILRLPRPVELLTCEASFDDKPQKKKPITLADLMAGRLPSFSGRAFAGQTWLPDGEHYLEGRRGQLLKVEARTGKSSPFYDLNKVAKSIREGLRVDEREARLLAEQAVGSLNPPRTAGRLLRGDDFYYVPLDGSPVVRLFCFTGTKELITWSPDGKKLAYVRDGDLYVVGIDDPKERRLTRDGSALITNGKTDWVYFEEIFNRNWKAYWWSPDSSAIAFLQIDATPVKKFTVIDQLPVRQEVEVTPYPKAGDPNPTVKVGVVAITGKPPVFADLGKYDAKAILVSRVGWLPGGKRAFFYLQDRAQTWLDFTVFDWGSGQSSVLFREKTRAWVEDLGEPLFLKDGSFVLTSERNGWKHLYHFDAAGKVKKQITTGEWEVRDVHRVDEKEGWIYFSGTKDSHLALNLYRVKLDGSDLTRLTKGAGDHRVRVAPQGDLFIDAHSDIQTPTRVKLFCTNGEEVRVLDANPVRALDEYEFARWEQVQIKAPDGFILDGMVLRPPHFDPKKKYPVWMKVYAGPHFPTLSESWRNGRIEDQALAQKGYVVFHMDPRSASGKGAVSAWTAYRQLGVQEMKDIETAVRWLTRQPGIDEKRVGISGHSYGGFMTAYALTHSKLFACGIAGAPVTDWRNYDTIYTERYMDTPQKNPKGYEETSVVRAARNLHGRLLIIHGNMDDNVHVQNTLQLADALQRADRDFEMMIYPRARHGIFGRHYRRLMHDFMDRNLKPGS